MWRFLRRLLKWTVVLAVLLAILVPVAILAMAVQRNPLLPPEAAVTPAQAAEARDFVRELRRASRETEGEQTVTATDAELEGLIATGARLFPGLRGSATTTPERLTLIIAAPLPGGLWANAALALGPSGPTPNLIALRLGRADLPPDLALSALRGGLDLATAEDFGSLLFGALRSMDMAPGRVTAVVDGGGLGADSLFSQGTAGLRDLLGLEAGERAAEHFAAMAEAARRGELPTTGSALPWLRHAVERVAEAGHDSGRAARQDLRAAILAFAAHCGDLKAIETFSGDIGEAEDATLCAETRLVGRLDLRKHFALSAAFAAAGTSAAAWGLGEVKELVDAGREGGSGFSFDDVALDRAGIRFAERLRRASLQELPVLATRIGVEADIAPSIEGLPSFMPDAEFTARFGGVEDPRYLAQLAEIDARIDALPFHAR